MSIVRHAKEEGLLVWTNKPLTIRGGYAGSGSPGALGETPTVLRNTAETVSGSTGITRRRIFYIAAVTNGTLANVTVRGGRIGTPTWNPEGMTKTEGAGLYVDACEDLVLDTVIVEENSHLTGFSQDNSGGGIYARDTTGILTNSVVRNNVISAKRGNNRGVGLYIEGGGWTVRDSVIRDNAAGEWVTSAVFYGAGVYVNGGTHVFSNSNYERYLALAPQRVRSPRCTFLRISKYSRRYEPADAAIMRIAAPSFAMWSCRGTVRPRFGPGGVMRTN